VLTTTPRLLNLLRRSALQRCSVWIDDIRLLLDCQSDFERNLNKSAFLLVRNFHYLEFVRSGWEEQGIIITENAPKSLAAYLFWRLL
jgi:hypothetical protein